jgi:hypothetical protein
VIDEHKLSAEEFERSHGVLGRHLGAMMADRREMLFQTIDERTELAEQRWISAIVYDCLAAHEFGNENYFGHFSFYCDPNLAFPDYLYDQQLLNLGAYFLLARGGRDTTSVHVVSRPIRDLLGSEWIAEMFAQVSQKRRLTEHLTSPSTPSAVREKLQLIKGLHGGIEDSSPCGVGLLAWAKLYEKFGRRLDEMVVNLRNCQFLDADHKYTPEVVTRLDGPQPQKIALVPYREPKYIGPSFEFLLLELLDEHVPDDIDLLAKPHISKLEMLNLTAIRSPSANPMFDEFPEMKALLVGDLWLVLNSLVELQIISERNGTAYLYLKKNVKRIVDAEAVRLAVDLFHLRNDVLDCFRFTPTNETHSQPSTRIDAIREYLQGKISFERLDQLSYRNTLMAVDEFKVQNLTTRSFPIQEALRRYYLKNRQILEGYLKDPSSFFTKVL